MKHLKKFFKIWDTLSKLGVTVEVRSFDGTYLISEPLTGCGSFFTAQRGYSNGTGPLFFAEVLLGSFHLLADAFACSLSLNLTLLYRAGTCSPILVIRGERSTAKEHVELTLVVPRFISSKFQVLKPCSSTVLPNPLNGTWVTPPL
jgi:hypothetical protein